MAELLADGSQRRRIDNGHKLGRVGHQNPVKQGLVLVPQAAQINIALKVTGFGFQMPVNTLNLPVQTFNVGWQKPFQTILPPLLSRKSCTLVLTGVIQEGHSPGVRCGGCWHYKPFKHVRPANTFPNEKRQKNAVLIFMASKVTKFSVRKSENFKREPCSAQKITGG